MIIRDLCSEKFSLRQFYTKRILRLFPNLILVIFFSLAVAPFFIWRDDYIDLGKQAAASAVFIGNISSAIQSGYFDRDANFRPLIHLWSLGVEEQFYLFFPIALTILWNYGKAHVKTFLILFGIVSFAICLTLTEQNPSLAFYMPFSRLWEFMCGAIVAFHSHQAKQLSAKKTALGTSSGIILIGALFLTKEGIGFPGPWALVTALATATVIASGQNAWFNRQILATGPLVQLGAISYGAYLWHWPILVFSRYVVGESIPIPLSIGLIAVSLLLATLTTKYFEYPIRRGTRGLSRIDARILLYVMAALGTISLASSTWIQLPESIEITKLENAPLNSSIDPWREESHCFVNLNQTFDFGNVCMGNNKANSQLAVLWGDSHAAHLWPGLSVESQQRGWDLAQFTVSQCPPVENFAGEHNTKCSAMRKKALDSISKLHPQTVILASRWTYYEKQLILDLLPTTVKKLKEAGVNRVIVIGPLPRWAPSLKKSLASDIKNNHLLAPPLFTNTGIEMAVFPMDSDLQLAARKAGADFISPLSILCNQAMQCRAWDDDSIPPVQMVFDSSHLTEAGSKWLALRIAPSLFPTPNL